MRLSRPRSIPLPIVALALAAGVGCQTTYYNTMEAFGVHKRDILTSRVQAARDDQEEAKEQFHSALEAFSAVVAFDGGNIEKVYNKLNDEYEASEAKAEAVHKRIADVEKVADALFKEWEDELELYSSAELRRSSERTLRETRQRYSAMLAAMHKAAGKMEPVLSRFRDQVLFLKHNLNARAIASLEDTVGALEADVASLIRELDSSIAEANAFIDSLATE